MGHKKPKKDGWYSEKSYQHFDRPWTFDYARQYVSNDNIVAKHSFLPFLSFKIGYRKISGSKKERPIHFASHRDSYIYSYYSKHLNILYESALSRAGLSECVLAYRAKLGSNVTFAKEVFDFIGSFADCVAIGLDIKGFFASIDHLLLKEKWKKIAGGSTLRAGEYAVFRSLTSYASVDRAQCYERLSFNQKQRHKTKPLCSPGQFRTVIKGRNSGFGTLVERNKQRFGIPQGSPISATLANVYMFDFDTALQVYVKKIGGLYRRYSDDILVVVEKRFEDWILQFIDQELAKLKLKVQAEKTIISHFNRELNGSLSLGNGDPSLQYLGFTFDGNVPLVRSQTISRYWRKVVRATRKAKVDAWRAGKEKRNSTVFRRQIYLRYSHLGTKNFISYVRKAASEMAPSTNYKRTKLWKQTKNHAAKIYRLLREW